MKKVSVEHELVDRLNIFRRLRELELRHKGMENYLEAFTLKIEKQYPLEEDTLVDD